MIRIAPIQILVGGIAILLGSLVGQWDYVWGAAIGMIAWITGNNFAIRMGWWPIENDSGHNPNEIKENDSLAQYKIVLEKFRKLGYAGDVPAQKILGEMYEFGQGVPQDETEAIRWIHRAADQGDAQALEWILKAAAQGNAIAQNRLGLLYNTGQGVPQDNAQALEWFLKAAAQGNAAAQLNVGALYTKGQGGPQDYAQAREWYLKAAAQGNADAKLELGWLFQNGCGVPQDYTRAHEWFRKAAEQGHKQAQYWLGFQYHGGIGVLQDLVQAYMWYSLAATQSEEMAVPGRKEVACKMTKEQIAKAQKFAREWKPTPSQK